MRFQEVSIAASGPLIFLCSRCGNRVNQRDAAVYADLDGEAFRAYYCVPCKEALMKPTTKGYDVYLNGELIDTVWFTGYTAEEARESLINHDGYDPAITVSE